MWARGKGSDCKVEANPTSCPSTDAESPRALAPGASVLRLRAGSHQRGRGLCLPLAVEWPRVSRWLVAGSGGVGRWRSLHSPPLGHRQLQKQHLLHTEPQETPTPATAHTHTHTHTHGATHELSPHVSRGPFTMPPSQGWGFMPPSRRRWCWEKAGVLLKVLWFLRAGAEFQIQTSLKTGPELSRISCLPRTRVNELPNLVQVLSPRACFPEMQFGSRHFPPPMLAVALRSWRSFLDGCGDRRP